MPGSILGNAVRRVEDPELVTGHGRYVDDLEIPGLLRAAFVRSPFPHARIVSVDIEPATSMPGVVGVFSADNLGVGAWQVSGANKAISRTPLASGFVMYAGDP